MWCSNCWVQSFKRLPRPSSAQVIPHDYWEVTVPAVNTGIQWAPSSLLGSFNPVGSRISSELLRRGQQTNPPMSPRSVASKHSSSQHMKAHVCLKECESADFLKSVGSKEKHLGRQGVVARGHTYTQTHTHATPQIWPRLRNSSFHWSLYWSNWPSDFWLE